MSRGGAISDRQVLRPDRLVPGSIAPRAIVKHLEIMMTTNQASDKVEIVRED
jgi:hypothetical protein